MSLAVAIRRSRTHYGIGADGRGTSADGTAMLKYARKWFRRGDWLGAFVGDIGLGQAFVRTLPLVGADVYPIEEHLLGTWASLILTHGERRGENRPCLDLDVMMVGPPGILKLAAYGGLFHVGEGYAAVGCGEAYALGRLDALGGESRDAPVADTIRATLLASSARYPSIGAPFEVEVQDGARPRPFVVRE